MARLIWVFAGRTGHFVGFVVLWLISDETINWGARNPLHDLVVSCLLNTNEPPRDKTNKMTVRPAKTQISLGMRPVWSESSLSAWRDLGSLATHWAHSKDSDQTGRMPRLIWVFAGRTVTLLVLSRSGSNYVINLYVSFSWSLPFHLLKARLPITRMRNRYQYRF